VLVDGLVVVAPILVVVVLTVVVIKVVVTIVVVLAIVVDELVVEQGQSLMHAPLNWHVLTLKQPRPFIVSQQQFPDTVVLAPEHVPKQHFMSLFWQL